MSQLWWFMLAIPTLERLRQETYPEFEANLGYIMRSTK